MPALALVHDDPIVNELCNSGPFTHLMKKFAVDDEGNKVRVSLDPGVLTVLMCGLPESQYRKPGGYVPIMKTITKGAEEAIKCGWTFNEYVHLLNDRNCQIMRQFRTDARTFHKDNDRPRYRKERDVVNHLMSIWAHAYTTLSDRKRPDRVAEIRSDAEERLHTAEELLDELFTAMDACANQGIDTGFSFGKNDRAVLRHYIAAGKAYGYYHPVMPVREVAKELFGDASAYKRAFTSLKNLRSEAGGEILSMIHRGKFSGQKSSGDASVYRLRTGKIRDHVDRLRGLAGLPDLDETDTETPAPSIPHPEGNRAERRKKKEAGRWDEKRGYISQYDIVRRRYLDYKREVELAAMPKPREDPATEDELFAMMCGEETVKAINLPSVNELNEIAAVQKREYHRAAMLEKRRKVAKAYLRDRRKKNYNPSPNIWFDFHGDYRTCRGPLPGQTMTDVYKEIAFDQGWDYADEWWRAAGSRLQIIALQEMSDDEVLSLMEDPASFVSPPVPLVDIMHGHLIPPDDRDEEIWFAEEALRTDHCNDWVDEEWEEVAPGEYIVTWVAPKKDDPKTEKPAEKSQDPPELE